MKNINLIFVVCLSVILFLLQSSCALMNNGQISQQHKIAPVPGIVQLKDSAGKYWWYVRFKFQWDNQYDNLKFSDNLIVADRILFPLLKKYQNDIDLWRFHRRAANDSEGHQFSFIFYSTIRQAEKIFRAILENPLTTELVNNKIVLNVYYDDLTKPDKSAIEDVSDKIWPEVIQKSWPYYIMGVCILWMDMVQQTIDKYPVDQHLTLNEQLQQYAELSRHMEKLWSKYAKHAFFHHMNAIFAYKAVEFHF